MAEGDGGLDGNSSEPVVLSDEDRATLEAEGVSLEGDNIAPKAETPPVKEDGNGGGQKPPVQTQKKTGEEEDEDDLGGVQPDGERRVPLAALKETRRALKELRERNQQNEALLEQVRQRIAQSRQQRQEPPADPLAGLKELVGKRPNKEDDPMAFLDWSEKTISALFEHITGTHQKQTETEQKQQQEQSEAQQREQYIADVVDAADQSLGGAIELDASVAEAYEFASQAVAEELQKNGLTGPKLQAAYRQALFNYAVNAPRDPERMREYVFRNARYWGWTPGAGGQKQPNDGGKNGNGTGVNRAPNGQFQKKDAVEQINSLKKVADAAKTLSGGGNNAGEDGLDTDILRTMSGAEVEELAETNPELLDKLMRKMGAL